MTLILATEKQRRDQTGFTLLELTIVLVILGIASSVVAPNLMNLDSRSFQAQVREATSALNYARRIAVVKGIPATTQIRLPVNEEQAPGRGGTSVRSASTAIWTGRDMDISYRDSTRQASAIEDYIEITFFPEGGSTGGEITLEQGNRSATLRIDPFSGRVTTEFENE